MSQTDRAKSVRLACDTGGTFTDLVVESDDGALSFFKAPTTPSNPIDGVLDVVEIAARDLGSSARELLSSASVFIHGTTRALNAMVTGETARTALLVTEGHPDILLFRDGGERFPAFDYTRSYPEPFVPRSLTFEVPERIGVDGSVVGPLEEQLTEALLAELAERDIESIAVCLLWSIVNPAHELRLGELISKRLPEIPFTLSHQLNATIREHRRAAAASVDAALKPLMAAYLGDLDHALETRGFDGRLLLLTSAGGMLDGEHAAAKPIHVLGSGPAAAPVAARYFAQLDGRKEIAVVGDAGGTTFDVAIVRGDEIPRTPETFIGDPHTGTPTGFPSVDIRSVGAGGGSIAWVDGGGLIHVGPQSAGASPGPACYGQGGTEPTVTDACLELGYMDPEFFLGGAMDVSLDLASAAIERAVAEPLELGTPEAAEAILVLACERMAAKIEELTILQGIDPAGVTFIGGGGGAGLYAVAIARRLGIDRILLPDVAPALSATGALLSDLESEFQQVAPMATDAFDLDVANSVLAELAESCQAFLDGPGAEAIESRIRFSADSRYAEQMHEIPIPLDGPRFGGHSDVAELHSRFHRVHKQMYAVDDPVSEVEVVAFRARVAAVVRPQRNLRAGVSSRSGVPDQRMRPAFFDGALHETAIWQKSALPDRSPIAGPAIIESALDTIVVPPGTTVTRESSLGWTAVDPGSTVGLAAGVGDTIEESSR